MKRLSKILICLILCVFAFSLVGCGKTIMHPDSDAPVYNNGGLSVRKGDYLYFVNGYMSAGSMTKRDAKYTLGAIMVAKLDADGNPIVKEDGSLDSGAYAKLSDKLCGFEATSLNIFGDYMYFTSPCQENEHGKWQKGRLVFFRVKLDGSKKAEKLYQTSSSILNDSNETKSEDDTTKPVFAYYNTGSSTFIIVYEGEDNKLVVINASNKNKVTVSDINNTAIPTEAGQIMYVKNADDNGKYSIHKLDVATGNDVELGKKDSAITVKSATQQYFFYEETKSNVDDTKLCYLPVSSNSIEESEVCWESIQLLSKYYIVPASADGSSPTSIIGIRDGAIQYKYNIELPATKISTFNGETNSINIIGTTGTNLFYYCTNADDENKIDVKTFNFSNLQAQPITVATIEKAATTYFDVNEDYLYFYKQIGENYYLHRLQINNNANSVPEQFLGVYIGDDAPAQD